jgi:hypothetical protein
VQRYEKAFEYAKNNWPGSPQLTFFGVKRLNVDLFFIFVRFSKRKKGGERREND